MSIQSPVSAIFPISVLMTGHPVSAKCPQIYRWQLSANGSAFALQVVSPTAEHAQRVFQRLYRQQPLKQTQIGVDEI